MAEIVVQPDSEVESSQSRSSGPFRCSSGCPNGDALLIVGDLADLLGEDMRDQLRLALAGDWSLSRAA